MYEKKSITSFSLSVIDFSTSFCFSCLLTYTKKSQLCVRCYQPSWFWWSFSSTPLAIHFLPPDTSYSSWEEKIVLYGDKQASESERERKRSIIRHPYFEKSQKFQLKWKDRPLILSGKFHLLPKAKTFANQFGVDIEVDRTNSR